MRRFLLLFAAVFLSLAAFAESSYTIVFKTGNQSGQKISDSTKLSTYISSGSEFVSGQTATAVYYATSNALQVGSSNTRGNLTLNFSEAGQVKITKVVVSAKKYSSDTSQLYVADADGQDLTKTTFTDYEFSVGDGNTVFKSLTFGVTGKRGYVQSITVYYSDGTGGGGGTGTTVAAPTVSAEYNVVTLACANEGAKIYYTIDGTEPTAKSDEYTASFTISAPTTVKAIAIVGEDKSTVTSEELPYYITNISEFNTISASNAAKCKVHLTNAIVAYYNSTKNQLYLVDGEYGVLVYGLSADLNPGDVISTVDGTFTIYNKNNNLLPEIQNAKLGEVTPGGTAPTPAEAVLDDFKYANSSKYVVIKNVTFDGTSTATFSDGKTLAVYNSNGIKLPSSGKYNITGFVRMSSTEAQIDAIKFEALSLSFSTANITITYGDADPVLELNNPGGVPVTWSSSDESVATVDQSGVVKVTGVGPTTITATAKNDATNFAELKLTVNPKPHGLAYEKTSYVVNGGESFTTPTLINPNELTVTYESSDTEVATVAENGTVTLTGNYGTTTITAYAEAQNNFAEGSASYTIDVKDPNLIEHVLTTSEFPGDNAYSTVREYTTPDGTMYVARFFESNGIQLNSNDKSYPGIVVTANPNGYILSKVTVEWSTGCTAGRSLEIYGSDVAYTKTDELNTKTPTADVTKGTLIGSLTSAKGGKTELDVTKPYSFIGIRALKAVNIEKITLVWKRYSGNTSSVESVVVDNEGAVEYFNLQGVRVQGTLAPGIYIRRSGNTATKISIR